MIKIQEIDKDKNKKDNYFIIYEIDKKSYSVYGSPENILNDLFKTIKNQNDKQNIF